MTAQPTKIKHFWCPENVVELTNSLKLTIPIDTEVVDLSDCHLNTSIPDNFFVGLPNLKGIIIRKSNIRIITGKTFAGLNSLEFIDLTDSHIMIIEPDAFDSLPKLSKLYLGGIPLDTIPPDLISGLPSLTSLVRPDGVEVRLDDTTTTEITTIGGTPFSGYATSHGMLIYLTLLTIVNELFKCTMTEHVVKNLAELYPLKFSGKLGIKRKSSNIIF